MSIWSHLLYCIFHGKTSHFTVFHEAPLYTLNTENIDN